MAGHNHARRAEATLRSVECGNAFCAQNILFSSLLLGNMCMLVLPHLAWSLALLPSDEQLQDPQPKLTEHQRSLGLYSFGVNQVSLNM
jgi:hypothetical protein